MWEAGIRKLQRAIETGYSGTDCWIHLGNSYPKHRQIKEALNCYLKVLDTNPESTAPVIMPVLRSLRWADLTKQSSTSIAGRRALNPNCAPFKMNLAAAYSGRVVPRRRKSN